MADNFLTKNRIELGQCLEFGDGLAIEAYPALNEALRSKVGPEAARLFAEPLLSRGNNSAPPTVSWYSEVDGDGQSFQRLDESAQSSVTAQLSRHLAAIGALIDDPDIGPLVSAALHLRDPDDIWVVDGRPVLINWGMLPAGQARDVASRTTQYERTLGRFLPLAAAPPLTSLEREERASRRGDAPRGADPVAASEEAIAAPPPPVAPAPPRVRRRVPLGAWVPLILLILIAAGVIAWLLVPGNRIFAERRAEIVETREAVALAEQVNRSLEERVVALRSALDGAVCLGDGTLLMPEGVTIEGLLPPNDLDPNDGPGSLRQAQPDPLVPPAAGRVRVAGAAGFPDTGSLLEHIEQRTAMVLVQGAKGLATGTGFFVGPDLVVTNYHVIENAGDGGIYVTNPALTSLKPAELIKALGPMSATGGDFALLRVPGTNQPSFPILAPKSGLRLQSVIAAGYPGDLLNTDRQFQALRSGNLDAVPDLAVTDGTISAEQRFDAGSTVIVHSAPISTGNSGGPLIDMCGRLIGVNTFVVQGPLRNLNFALSGPDLVNFLKGTAALPAVVTSECIPRVERPSVPRQDAPADPVTPPAAGGLAPLNLPPVTK